MVSRLIRFIPKCSWSALVCQDFTMVGRQCSAPGVGEASKRPRAGTFRRRRRQAPRQNSAAFSSSPCNPGESGSAFNGNSVCLTPPPRHPNKHKSAGNVRVSAAPQFPPALRPRHAGASAFAEDLPLLVFGGTKGSGDQVEGALNSRRGIGEQLGVEENTDHAWDVTIG